MKTTEGIKRATLDKDTIRLQRAKGKKETILRERKFD